MKRMIGLIFMLLLSGCCTHPDPGLQDPCGSWIYYQIPGCYDMSVRGDTCERPCPRIKPTCFCQCRGPACMVHYK